MEETNTRVYLQEMNHKMDNIPGSELGDRDLILGRGLGKSHPGNIRFRKLIKKWKFEYLDQPKADKPKIAAVVVREWRRIGGRFLERMDKTPQAAGAAGFDPTKEIWYDVGDKRAREKASMSLRERTPDAIDYVNKLKEEKRRAFEESCTTTRHPLQSIKTDTSYQPVSDYRYDAHPVDYSRAYATLLPPPPLNVRSVDSYYAHPPPPATWKDYSRGRPSLESDSSQAFEQSVDYRSHALTPLEAKQAEEIQQMKLSLAEHAKVIKKLKNEVAECKRKAAGDKNDKPRVTPNPYMANALLSPVPLHHSTGEENQEANLDIQETMFMFTGDTACGTQEGSLKNQGSASRAKAGRLASPAMGLLPPIKQEDDELWEQVVSTTGQKPQNEGHRSPMLNDVPTVKRTPHESMALVLAGDRKGKASLSSRHSFSPMASRKNSPASDTKGRGLKRNRSCPSLVSSKTPSSHGPLKSMKSIKTEEV